MYSPTSARDAEGYPLHGVDVAGPPPPRPRPRFETGIDPRLKEALKTDVPVPDPPLSEHEKLLIDKIRQLKKKDKVCDEIQEG